MQDHSPAPSHPAKPGRDVINELSDEALTAAGLVKVAAFVRGSQTTQAKRTNRHRQRCAEAGLRQVNVVAPASAHPVIKAIAERVRTGYDVRTALEHVLASEIPTKIQFTKRRNQSTGLQRLLMRLRGLGTALRAAARSMLAQGEKR